MENVEWGLGVYGVRGLFWPLEQSVCAPRTECSRSSYRVFALLEWSVRAPGTEGTRTLYGVFALLERCVAF